LIVIALAACADDPPPPPCVCYENFVMLAVQVNDAEGNPATGVTTETVRTSDGLDLTPRTSLVSQPGEYPLIDDNARGALATPAMITFTATGATGSATIEGVGSVDSCDCHVQFDGLRGVRLTEN
jgi:hypothetical protein